MTTSVESRDLDRSAVARSRNARLISVAVITWVLLGAAPPAPEGHFPPATSNALPNGVIVLTQISNDAPIVGAEVFVPAGLARQTADKAGIAAVTAAMVLSTPVEGGANLVDVANAAGGSISYTVDPEATRFEIESRASDLPRLLRDLAKALAKPDAAQFAAARSKVAAAAKQDELTPALVAYAMVRQVRYQGTGFAFPQGGRASTLARLIAADAQRFAESYLHGAGTIVALTGALSQADVDAAGQAFAGLPASTPEPAPTPLSDNRRHEIVAHRDVDAPWLALGYNAPSQFSNDFPAMLVVVALLGRGGDVHALSFGSGGSPAASDYIGAFYQYEAHPGTLVIFINGGNGDVDAAVRQIEQGVERMQSAPLPDDLITRGKQLALGDYYLSVTTLGEAAWLLGRSASSPEGTAFENALAARIAAVSAADVQRVARAYLHDETIAVVLPVSTGR